MSLAQGMGEHTWRGRSVRAHKWRGRRGAEAHTFKSRTSAHVKGREGHTRGRMRRAHTWREQEGLEAHFEGQYVLERHTHGRREGHTCEGT